MYKSKKQKIKEKKWNKFNNMRKKFIYNAKRKLTRNFIYIKIYIKMHASRKRAP